MSDSSCSLFPSLCLSPCIFSGAVKSVKKKKISYEHREHKVNVLC